MMDLRVFETPKSFHVALERVAFAIMTLADARPKLGISAFHTLTMIVPASDLEDMRRALNAYVAKHAQASHAEAIAENAARFPVPQEVPA